MRRTLALCAIFALSVFSSLSAFAAEKEWTYLVFMNGNNNLDSYGAMDINELESIGSTDKINVVVQWASLDAGSVKRVASAVGEGSMAIAFVHQYLQRMAGPKPSA